MKKRFKKALSFVVVAAMLMAAFPTSFVWAAADIYEPNNTIATASSIPLNVSGVQKHSFYPVDDIDYIKFNATAGKRYQAYVSAFPGNGGISNIVNSSGEILASPDQYGTIYWDCLSSGTYYIKTQKGTYPGEDYYVGILECEPDFFEPNDSFSAATALTVNAGEYLASQCSSILEPDIDYYKFNAEAGKIYKITVSGKAFFTQFYVKLCDSSEKVLWATGGGLGSYFGCNDPAILTLECTQSGTYYIKISDCLPVRNGLYGIKIESSSPVCALPRFAGANRYDTAAKISAANWPGGANCVVIATGENFPDALAGAPLAKAYGGPLLLTKNTDLPLETTNEINRLGATEVIVLGGEGAVSATVVSQIQVQTSVKTITRVAGQNRYETAKKIAEKLKEKLGTQMSSMAVIATGENFPDALAVSGFAGYKNMPILLVKKDALPTETSSAISSLGITSTIVVGGTGVVSDAVKNNLPLATRLAGANRYATAKAIAEHAAANGMNWATTYVATGANFPDALAAGAACAKNQGILLLTNPASLDLSPDTKTVLINNKALITNLALIGGAGAISDSAGNQIETVINF